MSRNLDRILYNLVFLLLNVPTRASRFLYEKSNLFKILPANTMLESLCVVAHIYSCQHYLVMLRYHGYKTNSRVVAMHSD